MVFVQLDGRTHDGVAQLRDPPAARARNLGDEGAQVQPLHEAGHLRAPAAIGGGGGAEEPRAHLAVAETLERVFAAEDGGEQGEVSGGRRVGRAGRPPVGIRWWSRSWSSRWGLGGLQAECSLP